MQQNEVYGGSSVEEAAKIFETIINGKGTDAQNNIVLTNAAIALQIVDESISFEGAFESAKNSLFGLKAKACLNRLTN